MTPQTYTISTTPNRIFQPEETPDRFNLVFRMRQPVPSGRALHTLLKPETSLEKTLIHQPEVLQGMWWGEPRFGHPEGNVVYHVQEIFENIDLLRGITPHFRQQLRLVALLHDTFKFREDRSRPRDWSKHHGILARNFAEKFIQDPGVLEVIEQHDEAYHIWHQYRQGLSFSPRFEQLMTRIQPYRQLFYVFFKCDTQTGDKTQAPWKWFEQQCPGLEKMIVRPDFEG